MNVSGLRAQITMQRGGQPGPSMYLVVTDLGIVLSAQLLRSGESVESCAMKTLSRKALFCFIKTI